MYSKDFEEILKAQEELAKKLANFSMNNEMLTNEDLNILNKKNDELEAQNEKLINEIKTLKIELASLKNSKPTQESYNILDKSLAKNKALLNSKQCRSDLEKVEASLKLKIQNLKTELYKYSNKSIYEIEDILNLATQKLNNLSTVINKNLNLADKQIDTEYEKLNNKYSNDTQNKNTYETYQDYSNNNVKDPISNNTESSETLNTSVPLKYSIYDNDFKLSEHEANNKDEKHKFEFKLGANVLNWIGVILLLLALITFGKYTYTNFLSITMKGIALFIISTIVLLLGEFIFSKKNENFSQGIISLGIAGLYTSVIVNTIFLETLTSKTALIIAIVITIVSIFITNKHNSRVIAMLTLIGAYICLVPYSTLDINSSYITFACYVLLNLGITSTSLFNKSNDNISRLCKTAVYVLGLLSYMLIANHIPNSILYIFSILATVLFNVMYIREYLSSFEIDILNFIVISAISLLTYSKTVYYFYSNSLFISLAYVGIYIVLAILIKYLCKAKAIKIASATEDDGIVNKNNLLGNIYFIHAIFFSVLLTLNLKITVETSIIILSGFALLVFITAKLLKENIFRYTSYIILAFSNILFFICSLQTTQLRISLIFVILAFLIIDSLKNNEEILVIIFKYYTLIFILLNTFIELINRDIPYKMSIMLILYLLFLIYFIMDKVNILKDEFISLFNPYFPLIIVLPAIVLIFNTFTIVSIAIIALSLLAIIIFSDRKAFYSLIFLTYVGIFVFNDINVFVSSVFVMLLALCSIVIGFKLDEVITRKYGLILALVVCAKLFLYDVQGVSTITRILLFFALGSIALGISYIYTSLEKKYKN